MEVTHNSEAAWELSRQITVNYRRSMEPNNSTSFYLELDYKDFIALSSLLYMT